MTDRTPEVIVALDVEKGDQARRLVEGLVSTVDFLKVGSRLFTAEGPYMVRELRTAGARIFLDLKFHDIPATVAGSVRAATGLGVQMMTLHTCGRRRGGRGGGHRGRRKAIDRGGHGADVPFARGSRGTDSPG